ncbi:unnamed protein product [Spirodela intermedia]|uniref:Uncharacterized protein n=1 Tax=Spirodela intermedia TaxID=51605 RepID=A0A7I8K152_SPIIN|nr:unnamed protein product [Spirodela intermedia]
MISTLTHITSDHHSSCSIIAPNWSLTRGQCLGRDESRM